MIIGAAIGIFISIIQHQRRILSEQELLNQISYVEEYMSKALRMATKDRSGDCLGADYSEYSYLLTRPENGFYTGIKFLNQSNVGTLGEPLCQEFYLDTATNILYSKIGNDNAAAITSSKLKINSIKFGIDGYNGKFASGFPVGDQSDDNPDITLFQPRVTIVMNVQIQGDTQQPTRTIQTTVSQRNINEQ